MEAKVNGQAIEDTKQYTIACSAFLGNGGDGFDMLKNGKLVYKSEVDMIEALLGYIRQTKELRIPALGRQVDLAKK